MTSPEFFRRKSALKLCTRGLLYSAGIVGVTALFVGSAVAAPITGTVNISGSLTDTGTMLDFTPPVGPPNGSFVVSNLGNTGTFATLSNTAGLIMDLNVGTEPVGTPIDVPGFITFAASPTTRLDLTFIQPGDFSSAQCGAAPAPGQTCTPPPGFGGAPGPNAIDLTNTQTGSAALIALNGNAVNTATGETSTWVGTLSAQFTVPYQTLLGEIAAGTPVSTSYSATFTTTAAVPEPVPSILVGSGLVGLFALRRLRKS